MLRIGDGVASGTVRGGVEDGFRVLGLGAIGSSMTRAALTNSHVLPRLIKSPNGARNACNWVASARGLARAGQKLKGTKYYASVTDIARAKGTTIPRNGIALETMTGYLSSLGAKVSPVYAVRTFDEAAKIARDGSGAVFLLGCKRFRIDATGAKVREELGHTFTFYAENGGVTILNEGRAFRDFVEAARATSKTTVFEPAKLVRLENVFAVHVQTEGRMVVAMEVGLVVANETKEGKQ
jgi:hypothetical protein